MDQRATYNALASIPSVIIKLPTSLLSAAVVTAYCPNDVSPCDAHSLWASIMGFALITPVGLAAGWFFLQEPLRGPHAPVEYTHLTGQVTEEYAASDDTAVVLEEEDEEEDWDD